MKQELTVAVVIASAGRPELLAQALESVAAQEGVVFRTVVSVPDVESLPADPSVMRGVTVVTGVRGLAAQRNAGIAAVADADVIAFFDDDSLPRRDWIAMALDFLQQHPDVVGLTGRVLLDGAVSGEITRDTAMAAILQSDDGILTGRWRRWDQLYGCNFAIRLDLIGDERFDERLPLYSWLEDHDMARRLMRVGYLAKVDDCIIVHRAASSGGRQKHQRLGYSQVMNPLYFYSKGSFPLSLATREAGRLVLKNFVYSIFGLDRAWRRERLRGNLLAASDGLKGRRTPERVVEL